MTPIIGELRQAVRRLRGSPVFTIAATITLAIAIGATASVFGLVDGVDVIGRLKPEATVQSAQVDLATTAQRLAVAYPKTNEGWSVATTPLLDHIVGPVRPALLMLLSAAPHGRAHLELTSDGCPVTNPRRSFSDV